MAAEPTAANPLDQVDPAWAWSPFEPGAEMPWNRDRAAHLFRRAGFGANWHELERSMAEGCQASVERLIAGKPESQSFYADADRAVEALLGSSGAQHLPAWWLHVMLRTPHPLLEKLTLFWHGHFATSAAKVTDPRMMHRQNAILRRHALGRFGSMLNDVAKDPAMLIWLDSVTNHKAHPNENFAREVMELFALGLGNYTEHDIKEAARAFTGWELRQGEYRFNRSQHDAGPKTVLGQTGPWTGDDVLRILLMQPAASRFLVRKLFRQLVCETSEPPERLIEPLATVLRVRDYDLAWLAQTMLGSRLFYSPLAMRQRIKGPVEFAIGLLRAVDATANTYALADSLRTLGQAVFFPPNVKGWDGGTTWINSATLVGRANLVWDLLSDREGRFKTRVRLERLGALAGMQDAAQQARRLVELLLSFDVPERVAVQLTAVAADASAGDEHARLSRVAQAVATLPEYQLA